MNGKISTHNQELIDQYLEEIWLLKGLSDNTIESYRSDLESLARWSVASKPVLSELTNSDLLAYVSARHDAKYHPRSTARLLSCLRSFFGYLLEREMIGQNPALNLSNPKIGRPLPKSLSEDEVEILLQTPDTSTALGLRDRAMLEMLYSCGLRISELIKLNLSNLNLMQGVIRIFGKGSKERLVPMGDEAQFWLQKFIDRGRQDMLYQASDDILFPSKRGTAMTRQTFWHRIKKYAITANIQQSLSPHTLRHAFASHLLNNGADLRVVQLLLGHSSLSTTQIYTHIAQQRLYELHSTHHPRG